MAERKAKRFYKTVSVAESDGGFAVLLDGRPLKTPSRATLALPKRALAEALAEEWAGQGEVIDPEALTLTRLVNTAAERVANERAPVAEQVLALGRSDLLCYRAENQPELAARQATHWDPLLEWLTAQCGARLSVGAGITFIEQPPEAVMALEQAIWKRDDFALAGLAAAATLLGSAVLGLALVEGRLAAAEAFRLATLDEAFQSEQWGEDEEARARLERLRAELEAVERFLRLLK